MTSPADSGVRSRLVEAGRRPVLLACIAVHALFLVAPLDVLAPVDPHDIGRRLLRGELPYVDFQLEYPPFAVLPLLVAGLAPGALALQSLALQALVLEVVVLRAVIRHHDGAVVRFAVLSALLFPFLSGGFDAYVMAGLAVATALLARGDVRGWWTAAALVPLKLATLTTWVWGRVHLRTAVVAGGLAGSVALLPVALVGLTDASWVGYSLERGTQAESVAASTHWLLERAGGREVDFVYRFRAWEIVGADGAVLAWTLLGGLGLATLAVVAFRRPVDAWLAAYAAALLFLVTNKVLSPQFIAWSFPIAAVLGGRWFLLHLALAVGTVVPFVFGGSLDAVSPWIAGRNGVLVSTAAAALFVVVRDARGADP